MPTPKSSKNYHETSLSSLTRPYLLQDRHSRQSVPFSVRVSYQRKVQMFHEEKIRTCHKIYLTPTELTLSSFLTEAVVLLVLLLFFGKQNNIRRW